jgi:hypothetical protein
LLLRILDCKINNNKKRIRRIKIKFKKGRIKEEEEEKVASLSNLGHAKRDFILKRSPSLFL